jgi:hypothetical protein
MPNLYLYMGPSSAPSAESTLHMIEFSCAYMIFCIQKLQRACRAWMRQVGRYFGNTTFTYTCKSWAKANVSDGIVMAIWPGSSVHARVPFQNPRWEGYEFEYLDEGWGEDGKEDFLALMGNRLTESREGKTTRYLDDVEDEVRGGVLKVEELSFGIGKVNGVNCA